MGWFPWEWMKKDDTQHFPSKRRQSAPPASLQTIQQRQRHHHHHHHHQDSAGYSQSIQNQSDENYNVNVHRDEKYVNALTKFNLWRKNQRRTESNNETDKQIEYDENHHESIDNNLSSYSKHFYNKKFKSSFRKRQQSLSTVTGTTSTSEVNKENNTSNTKNNISSSYRHFYRRSSKFKKSSVNKQTTENNIENNIDNNNNNNSINNNNNNNNNINKSNSGIIASDKENDSTITITDHEQSIRKYKQTRLSLPANMSRSYILRRTCRRHAANSGNSDTGQGSPSREEDVHKIMDSSLKSIGVNKKQKSSSLKFNYKTDEILEFEQEHCYKNNDHEYDEITNESINYFQGNLLNNTDNSNMITLTSPPKSFYKENSNPFPSLSTFGGGGGGTVDNPIKISSTSQQNIPRKISFTLENESKSKDTPIELDNLNIINNSHNIISHKYSDYQLNASITTEPATTDDDNNNIDKNINNSDSVFDDDRRRQSSTNNYSNVMNLNGDIVQYALPYYETESENSYIIPNFDQSPQIFTPKTIRNCENIINDNFKFLNSKLMDEYDDDVNNNHNNNTTMGNDETDNLLISPMLNNTEGKFHNKIKNHSIMITDLDVSVGSSNLTTRRPSSITTINNNGNTPTQKNIQCNVNARDQNIGLLNEMNILNELRSLENWSEHLQNTITSNNNNTNKLTTTTNNPLSDMLELIKLKSILCYPSDIKLKNNVLRSTFLSPLEFSSGTFRKSQTITLRKYSKTFVKFSMYATEAIKKDFEILSKIRHSDIIILMAISYDKLQNQLTLIFEPVDYTLHYYLHQMSEGQLTIFEIISIVQQIANAINYLHSSGYIHSNISSHCILMKKYPFCVKLTSFELCTEIDCERIKFDIQEKYEKYEKCPNNQFIFDFNNNHNSSTQDYLKNIPMSLIRNHREDLKKQYQEISKFSPILKYMSENTTSNNIPMIASNSNSIYCIPSIANRKSNVLLSPKEQQQLISQQTEIDSKYLPYNCEYRNIYSLYYYQQPEHLLIDEQSQRFIYPTKSSDIYNLTLLLWEILNNCVPFIIFNKSELIKLYATHQDIEVTSSSSSLLPIFDLEKCKYFEKIFQYGLELKPEKRTMDVQQMIALLEEIKFNINTIKRTPVSHQQNQSPYYENSPPKQINCDFESNNNNNKNEKLLNVIGSPQSITDYTEFIYPKTMPIEQNYDRTSTLKRNSIGKIMDTIENDDLHNNAIPITNQTTPPTTTITTTTTSSTISTKSIDIKLNHTTVHQSQLNTPTIITLNNETNKSQSIHKHSVRSQISPIIKWKPFKYTLDKLTPSKIKNKTQSIPKVTAITTSSPSSYTFDIPNFSIPTTPIARKNKLRRTAWLSNKKIKNLSCDDELLKFSQFSSDNKPSENVEKNHFTTVDDDQQLEPSPVQYQPDQRQPDGDQQEEKEPLQQPNQQPTRTNISIRIIHTSTQSSPQLNVSVRNLSKEQQIHQNHSLQNLKNEQYSEQEQEEDDEHEPYNNIDQNNHIGTFTKSPSVIKRINYWNNKIISSSPPSHHQLNDCSPAANSSKKTNLSKSLNTLQMNNANRNTVNNVNNNNGKTSNANNSIQLIKMQSSHSTPEIMPIKNSNINNDDVMIRPVNNKSRISDILCDSLKCKSLNLERNDGDKKTATATTVVVADHIEDNEELLNVKKTIEKLEISVAELLLKNSLNNSESDKMINSSSSSSSSSSMSSTSPQTSFSLKKLSMEKNNNNNNYYSSSSSSSNTKSTQTDLNHSIIKKSSSNLTQEDGNEIKMLSTKTINLSNLPRRLSDADIDRINKMNLYIRQFPMSKFDKYNSNNNNNNFKMFCYNCSKKKQLFDEQSQMGSNQSNGQSKTIVNSVTNSNSIRNTSNSFNDTKIYLKKSTAATQTHKSIDKANTTTTTTTTSTSTSTTTRKPLDPNQHIDNRKFESISKNSNKNNTNFKRLQKPKDFYIDDDFYQDIVGANIELVSFNDCTNDRLIN